VNSIIVLLNLNELFSYSYILSPPSSGFSEYLYRVFRLENFEFSWLSPYSLIENSYYVVYSNEVNIKGLKLFSYEIYIYLIVLAFYIYFTYFYKQRQTKYPPISWTPQNKNPTLSYCKNCREQWANQNLNP
jgi:hypothetical protein